MSLLNNALREAEERQRRPEVTGAYTGAVQQSPSGGRWLVILIFLLALGLAAAGIYWFATAAPATGGTERAGTNEDNALTSVEDGQVERTAVVSEAVVAPEPKPEPEQEREPAPEPEPAMPEPEPQNVAAEEITQPSDEAEPPEPEARDVRETPEVQEVQAASAPEPESSAPEPETRPEPEQAPAVKSTPQSPQAVDRQTAKELDTLISGGRMVEAERRLMALTESQLAPRSRDVLARALLVDGHTERALNWLPADVVARDANLRMLRARAEHAAGRLDAAIATLESRVPAVAEQPEYRVTLATLLQQRGEGQKAAAQWAELIAWDDSRAPWWVGLAVALEAQGEIRGATRAYEQAAALPGLPSSLEDYVQRRLQSLRAG